MLPNEVVAVRAHSTARVPSKRHGAPPPPAIEPSRHPSPRQPTKGELIRAKIEANRQKRLAIADAMKAEAGVTQHDVNFWDLSGIAFLDVGVILSPEGQNIAQLHTVAHECGHIYLHGGDTGVGRWLPTHVQEMEAEMYAHQAFAEHGMTMPADHTAGGRAYVGTWVETDRAAGIRIDPRVEAYVRGERSPYEPLRRVPATWTVHTADPVAGAPMPAHLWRWYWIRVRRSPWWTKLRELLSDAWDDFYVGHVIGWWLIIMLDIYPPIWTHLTLPNLAFAITVGLSWASLRLSWRVLSR